jgi:hypothetical protein
MGVEQWPLHAANIYLLRETRFLGCVNVPMFMDCLRDTIEYSMAV